MKEGKITDIDTVGNSGFILCIRPSKKGDWETCFGVSTFGFIDWSNERYDKKNEVLLYNR